MKHSCRAFVLAVLFVIPFAATAQPPKKKPTPKPGNPPVAAVVETSLATAKEQIRQFAFDGNPDTYFASATNPTKADHFTLIFDRPVAVKSIAVTTGKSGGEDALKTGVLEGSVNGKAFVRLEKFVDGKAAVKGFGRKFQAIRIRSAEALSHPLVVREIVIDSYPAVGIFKYPVEFVVDTSEAPEMKDWTEKAARLCERHYGMICDELMSDGFKPLTIIPVTMKKNYDGIGVAMVKDFKISASAKFFKDHPEGAGAMIHEATHCVQFYKQGNNPGWLVEGIADYIRYWKYRYEPDKVGRLTPEKANYDGSYQVTAAFLAFLVERYDPEIVKKLNARMREGKYSDEIWKELTGKTVEQLNQEWRRSLVR